MKLYTEEQVLNSMLSMKTYIEKYDESVIDTIVEKHLKSLGGIEIPSDEDIEKEAPYSTLGWGYEFGMNDGFKKGAKFVIDKIQGGEK